MLTSVSKSRCRLLKLCVLRKCWENDTSEAFFFSFSTKSNQACIECLLNCTFKTALLCALDDAFAPLGSLYTIPDHALNCSGIFMLYSHRFYSIKKPFFAFWSGVCIVQGKWLTAVVVGGGAGRAQSSGTKTVAQLLHVRHTHRHISKDCKQNWASSKIFILGGRGGTCVCKGGRGCKKCWETLVYDLHIRGVTKKFEDWSDTFLTTRLKMLSFGS